MIVKGLYVEKGGQPILKCQVFLSITSKGGEKQLGKL